MDYLIGIGYNKKRVYFVPVSALHDVNVGESSPKKIDWFEGKNLFDTID